MKTDTFSAKTGLQFGFASFIRMVSSRRQLRTHNLQACALPPPEFRQEAAGRSKDPPPHP